MLLWDLRAIVRAVEGRLLESRNSSATVGLKPCKRSYAQLVE